MRIVIVLALTLACAGPVSAQPFADHGRGELVANLASAHIFRAEDRSFGNPVAIGGGVRLPIARRLGIEVEVNRALGLQAAPARCGILGGCEGTAREGVLDATLATANVYVRFPHGRVEPFLIGGVGGLWTTSVNSVTRMRDGVGVMSELEQRDAGLAIGFGGGRRRQAHPQTIGATRDPDLRFDGDVANESRHRSHGGRYGLPVVAPQPTIV